MTKFHRWWGPHIMVIWAYARTIHELMSICSSKSRNTPASRLIILLWHLPWTTLSIGPLLRIYCISRRGARFLNQFYVSFSKKWVFFCSLGFFLFVGLYCNACYFVRCARYIASVPCFADIRHCLVCSARTIRELPSVVRRTSMNTPASCMLLLYYYW